ncbi:MAG: AFG1 family ATPase [Gammaproteobacteria bacterium]|nr:AFG1 family ATPase [Gammaproteobacteria bacterium]
MVTLPSGLYQQRLLTAQLRNDAGQLHIVDLFDQLHARLLLAHDQHKNGRSIWARLLTPWRAQTKYPAVRGLYLWGDVGRGKTLLMDIFYESLPKHIPKERQHFHHFMQMIHQQLHKHTQQQNPLVHIARELAQKFRVLCLDEFFVSDIGDAMILANLLEAFFDNGVCVITTSNRIPDDLYKDGLQRARFLPAIALIKTHCHIVQLDHPIDYRLQTLQRDGTYHWPLNTAAEQHLSDAFMHLTEGHATHAQANHIQINDREIPTQAQADGVVWFSFGAICEAARSQIDYIEIAREYHTVLISNIPIMDKFSEDAARRFLNLLDVFYDHRVKLIVSAAAPVTDLYCGTRLSFEFDRATSRLIEMQSEEYLRQSHQA